MNDFNISALQDNIIYNILRQKVDIEPDVINLITNFLSLNFNNHLTLRIFIQVFVHITKLDIRGQSFPSEYYNKVLRYFLTDALKKIKSEFVAELIDGKTEKFIKDGGQYCLAKRNGSISFLRWRLFLILSLCLQTFNLKWRYCHFA